MERRWSTGQTLLPFADRLIDNRTDETNTLDRPEIHRFYKLKFHEALECQIRGIVEG